MGKVNYASALKLQRDAVSNYVAPVLFLCEHYPPVYTAGKRLPDFGDSEQAKGLINIGAECFSTSRGGLITWHGPGQLTVYPIIDISEVGMKNYVHLLEECIINTAAQFSVNSARMNEVGVCTKDKKKFGFIGVAQSKGIAYHGLSINVSNDLSWFNRIVPCGIVDLEITTLEKETARSIITIDGVKETIKRQLLNLFASLK